MRRAAGVVGGGEARERLVPHHRLRAVVEPKRQALVGGRRALSVPHPQRVLADELGAPHRPQRQLAAARSARALAEVQRRAGEEHVVASAVPLRRRRRRRASAARCRRDGWRRRDACSSRAAFAISATTRSCTAAITARKLAWPTRADARSFCGTAVCHTCCRSASGRRLRAKNLWARDARCRCRPLRAGETRSGTGRPRPPSDRRRPHADVGVGVENTPPHLRCRPQLSPRRDFNNGGMQARHRDDSSLASEVPFARPAQARRAKTADYREGLRSPFDLSVASSHGERKSSNRSRRGAWRDTACRPPKAIRTPRDDEGDSCSWLNACAGPVPYPVPTCGHPPPCPCPGRDARLPSFGASGHPERRRASLAGGVADGPGGLRSGTGIGRADAGAVRAPASAFAGGGLLRVRELTDDGRLAVAGDGDVAGPGSSRGPPRARGCGRLGVLRKDDKSVAVRVGASYAEARRRHDRRWRRGADEGRGCDELAPTAHAMPFGGAGPARMFACDGRGDGAAKRRRDVSMLAGARALGASRGLGETATSSTVTSCELGRRGGRRQRQRARDNWSSRYPLSPRMFADDQRFALVPLAARRGRRRSTARTMSTPRPRADGRTLSRRLTRSRRTGRDATTRRAAPRRARRRCWDVLHRPPHVHVPPARRRTVVHVE